MKEKLIFHVTTVMHNARYSERMRMHNVEWKDYRKLNIDEEIQLTKIIGQIITEENWEVLEYNICGDHIHMIITVTEDTNNAPQTPQLARTIGRLKGISSRRWNLDKGVNPLAHGAGHNSKVQIESLWAQKFNRRLINNDEDLQQVIHYIQTNRQKHKLIESEELKQIIDNFVQRPLDNRLQPIAP